MAKTKTKIVRRLNVKAFILLLLILYFIGVIFYFIINLPIQNIYIENTNLITDNEIICTAGIKDYPSFLRLNSKKLEQKITDLDLVNHVKVKKTFTGKVIITIDEAKPLFYNRNTNRVVLSNGKEVEKSEKYLGIPTLINYVPSELLSRFIASFSKIDSDIIGMINEIEYNPDVGEDIVIDAERFYLRMNDTNFVYVNVINMNRLNNYIEVMMTIGDKRGTLYLDSYNSDNSLFTEFEKIEVGESEIDEPED